MKKILPVFFAILIFSAVIAAGAAGFWLLRPETHRAGFERALSGAFKAEARIGRMVWVWSKGSPGIELRSLALRPSASAEDFAAFTASKIRLILDAPALLRKALKVQSIRIDQPQLELLRTPEGLTAGGVDWNAVRWNASSDLSQFKWSVDQIVIAGGSLGYEDRTAKNVRRIDLKSIEFRTRPPKPDAPLAFEGRAGFLTPMPNASFEGSFRQDADGKGWTAALTRIRLGFEKIPVRAIERAFPEAAGLGLRGQPAGALSGSIERVRHTGRQLRELTGNLQIEGAKLMVRAFKSPIQDLNAAVHFDRDTIVLSLLDGRIAGGEFVGRGEVKNLDKPDPDAGFEFRAERLNLSALFPRPTDGRPQLTGRASFEVAGHVQGRTSAEWLASLKGEGSVAIADGILVNANILRQIFDKLAASLPGAQDAFARTMPPDLNARLAASDTAFAPAQIPFFIGNGGVVFPNFRIAGDGFEIAGSGQQGFAGDIDFRTTLILDAQVSAYVISCAPDAAAIADAYGRLSLPVRLTGTVRNVKIQPDTQYLIQRILSVKGPQYLMKALQGK